MKHQFKYTNSALLLIGIMSMFSQNAAADETVKIGSAAPLTGAIAHLGQDQANGVILAIEEINKSGLTIGGQKVTLVIDSQDDAADPRTGTQIAQKLVDDGVVAVVGHLNSGVSIPSSKIYNDAGVTMISPASTNPTLTLQGFKVTYRVIGTDAQQGPALATYASKGLKVKSVAIVDDATAYGQGLANAFEQKAKALGIKVLSHEATNDKATDFRAIITKIKGERPSVIMYGGMDATGGPFAKQARQLAVAAKVLAGDGACTADLGKLAGDAVNNVVCSIPGTALQKLQGGDSFLKKYQARFGQPVQIYAPFSYDAVHVIVDAMKRANSTKRADILAAMPKTKTNGVIGPIQFDEHGDLKDASISVYGYENGKQHLVDVMKM
jgi:branched-chain amino acid transport system substrate-binding protein